MTMILYVRNGMERVIDLINLFHDHDYELIVVESNQKAYEFSLWKKPEVIFLREEKEESVTEYVRRIKNGNNKITVCVMADRLISDRIVRAWNSGIDNYISKEYGEAGLLAYVRHVRREIERVKNLTRLNLTEDIYLDLEQRKLYITGMGISLAKNQYMILKMLVEHKNEVVWKKDMYWKIWKVKQRDHSVTIRKAICYFRRLFSGESRIHIQNCYKTGYILFVKEDKENEQDGKD